MSKYLFPIIILLVSVGSFLVYRTLHGVSQAEVTVREVYWQRKYEIEAFEEVEKKGTTIPSGARVISSHKADQYVDEIVGYREICDTVESSGQKERGSGSGGASSEDGVNAQTQDGRASAHAKGDHAHAQAVSCRQEPIIQKKLMTETMYTYAVSQWVKKNDVVKEGNSNKELEWPVYQEDSEHRIARRQEVLKVYLLDEHAHKEHTYNVDKHQYEYLAKNIGKTCRVSWSYLHLKTIVC